MNMKNNKIKRCRQDVVFDVVNTILMAALLVVLIWPLWFVVIASISDPYAVNAGEVMLLPKKITLKGYEYMFQYRELIRGYLNTIYYTVTGTALNMIFSVAMAYPLSEKGFKPRGILTGFFMFTMYFNGGLIPNYLLMKSLGILNTRWAMIVPGMISVYNTLIIRSYFINSIPNEIKEASMIDGAGQADYLFKILLPLSKPVLAVIGLYYMVEHWNDFSNALYYIYDTDLVPLQTVLRNLLMSSKMTASILSEDAEAARKAYEVSQSMKYAVIIAAVLPMTCIYPWVQKYFAKGMMVGSVKG